MPSRLDKTSCIHYSVHNVDGQYRIWGETKDYGLNVQAKNCEKSFLASSEIKMSQVLALNKFI